MTLPVATTQRGVTGQQGTLQGPPARTDGAPVMLHDGHVYQRVGFEHFAGDVGLPEVFPFQDGFGRVGVSFASQVEHVCAIFLRDGEDAALRKTFFRPVTGMFRQDQFVVSHRGGVPKRGMEMGDSTASQGGRASAGRQKTDPRAPANGSPSSFPLPVVRPPAGGSFLG